MFGKFWRSWRQKVRARVPDDVLALADKAGLPPADWYAGPIDEQAIERQSSRMMDLAAHGIPQTEAEAKRRGYSWKVCKEANDAQHEVAECRRRANNNPDLLNMRLD